MKQDVYVAGIGMVPFTKPGASEHYPQMASKNVNAVLRDACLSYAHVQQAYVEYVYSDSTAGQRALYEVGMTGIPVVNVINNCSTGSTPLFLARQAIMSGEADCVLALGFEQMNPGALGAVFIDHASPLQRFDEATEELVGHSEIPLALRYFGGADLSHIEEFGTPMNTFAKIRAEASRNEANNPLALFRKVVIEEEVMNAPVMWPGVMTRLMACPPTCGAAAAIVCSETFARQHGLSTPVRVRAQAMTTDTTVTFDVRDMREVVVSSMAKACTEKVYAESGIGPRDIQVVELHDCFAHNELLSCEALGLCERGGAQKFIEDGDNTFSGQVVTNLSGGLLSKGHPLSAKGLAQCTEMVQQLRGQTDKRQVEGARIALKHKLGLGCACVIIMYEKAAA